MDVAAGHAWAREVESEIRFDDLTRQLYATDASIYQITPLGVAFPRTAAEASGVMRAAAEAGVEIIPRGAGTGLAGGAVGAGLVVDFARHNRRIGEVNRDRQTVRVGAGVVLDELNDHLRPFRLCFGPEVATSSRATLGGMIANNSSGSRAAVYGTTVEHVVSVEVVLADGRVATVGGGSEALAAERAAVDRLVEQHEPAIRERMPEGLLKRWGGYGFDEYLHHKGDLSKLIAGSEGTLAGIVSAELRVVELPAGRGLAVICFASVAEAMQASVELAELKPAAIEHIDRVLFDQTKGQLAFRAARSLLGLDQEPCESMLLVEFLEEVEDKLAALSRRRLGLRKLLTTDEREIEAILSVRQKGLSLLTGCKGPAKPTAGVEDAAVRPEQLPAYVEGLRSILEGIGLEASFYGHASAGLLHVRPVVDLHTAEGLSKFRRMAEEVSALVKQFRGSLAGEHGVGMARTEFLAEHLGAVLTAASAELKAVFDPKRVMNPGKIVDDGRYGFDGHLRQGAERRIELPFAPVVGFVRKDESLVGNLEQCNGCGGCRKAEPTMCPTYVATGEEIMSTRGRANVIRAILEQRLGGPGDALVSAELEEALGNCLSCKACKTECPSNVDLALLKAELLRARHEREGVGAVDRVLGAVDWLGRVGCATRPVANAALNWGPLRWLLERTVGISAARLLPEFAGERFDRWFGRRKSQRTGTRGRVILWDDTFVRYYEPWVGRAAVAVLEAAGYEVVLPEGRECCGRPAFSRGLLDKAARLGRHNVGLLSRFDGDAPIVFLEPSCYSMFVDDYLELRVPGAEAVARRCRLFEDFVCEELEAEPAAVPFRQELRRVAIHAHCHAKALTEVGVMGRLAEHLPLTSVHMLRTGCCGMAGAFGALRSKYELSVQVAKPLVEQIEALPAGTTLVASGMSCRQQIRHLTAARPIHMAELLAEAVGC